MKKHWPLILLCWAFVGLLTAQVKEAVPGVSKAHREVAVTVDDLPKGGDYKDLKTIQAVNRQMLSTLVAHRVPAIGFVNERKLYFRGEVDARIEVLRMWLEAGMALGNHGFAHLRFHDTPLAQYQDDVIRGEAVTRQLMHEKGARQLYFRHPYTSTGATREAREAFEAFLKSRNYAIAPFTVENADFVFNEVLVRARQKRDEALAQRARKAYLDFTDTMFDYFERRSREILRYEVKQILILHVNEINAECLDEILRRLRSRGYSFVSLEEALRDKAYQIKDDYVGPMGLSWLHRWTVSLGIDMKYKEEPDPPKFILDLYRAK